MQNVTVITYDNNMKNNSIDGYFSRNEKINSLLKVQKTEVGNNIRKIYINYLVKKQQMQAERDDAILQLNAQIINQKIYKEAEIMENFSFTHNTTAKINSTVNESDEYYE